MDKIELKNALPEVFASRDDIRSEIWHREVTFERGHLYLVEAGSGTGKSSLCSYIIGYRNDYQGIISFDGKNIRNYKVKDWVELRKRSLSHLFQELRLFPELTAYENVAIKNGIQEEKTDRSLVRRVGHRRQVACSDKPHEFRPAAAGGHDPGFGAAFRFLVG